MSNIQQPEMRRSEETPTGGRYKPEDSPSESSHGGHDRSGDRPVPKGQVSPYGPDGKQADDNS